jgi:hypothetical protein
VVTKALVIAFIFASVAVILAAASCMRSVKQRRRYMRQSIVTEQIVTKLFRLLSRLLLMLLWLALALTRLHQPWASRAREHRRSRHVDSLNRIGWLRCCFSLPPSGGR